MWIVSLSLLEDWCVLVDTWHKMWPHKGFCSKLHLYVVKHKAEHRQRGSNIYLPLLKVTIKPLTSSNDSKIKENQKYWPKHIYREFADKKLTFCTQAQPLHHKLSNVNTAILKKLECGLSQKIKMHEQRQFFFQPPLLDFHFSIHDKIFGVKHRNVEF